MDDDNMKQLPNAGWRWRGRVGRLGAGAVICAATLTAQTFTLNPLTSAGVRQNGFHVYNFSAYTQYSTVDQSWINLVNTLSATSGTPLPGYTTASGVTAAVGLHFGGGEGGRSDFSLLYSPSYSYNTYGQTLNQLTNTLALSWSRKLAPQWQFSVSASGVSGEFDQLLFSPTNAQNLAALAGTAEELAGQVLTGQSSNSSIAAGTGASATISPQLQLFYGDRLVSALARVGLAYSHSQRLTFEISGNGSRMQHLKQNASAGENYYLIPQSTAADCEASISYSLTQRTTFSGSVQYGRVISSIEHAQTTAATLGLGRHLTQRWFTSFTAGGGYVLPTRSSTAVRGKQWQASGSIGHRGYSHTLIATAMRSISDLYGVGAPATLTAEGGWSWQRPGMRWALQAGVGGDRLLGQPALATLATNGIRVNAGLYRTLSRHAVVVLQYAYTTFWGVAPSGLPTTNGQQLQFAQHSIRLNFGFGAGGGVNGQNSTVSATP